MILIDTPPPLPNDIHFYIWLVGILFTIVSFIIGWIVMDTKNIIKEVRTSVNQLVTNDALKQQRIDTMDERILNIESKIFVVVYPK